jgi:hypothetical protein
MFITGSCHMCHVVARWPWLFTHDHLEGVCWTMSEFSSSAVVILYPV